MIGAAVRGVAAAFPGCAAAAARARLVVCGVDATAGEGKTESEQRARARGGREQGPKVDSYAHGFIRRGRLGTRRVLGWLPGLLGWWRRPCCRANRARRLACRCPCRALRRGWTFRPRAYF